MSFHALFFSVQHLFVIDRQLSREYQRASNILPTVSSILVLILYHRKENLATSVLHSQQKMENSGSFFLTFVLFSLQ